jgi:hypothetical protein
VRSESRCALRLRYVDKVKRDQACTDARGHNFKQLLQVHSYFPNADLQNMFANKIKRVQARIDAGGHHFPIPFISAQRLSENRSAESVCE